MAFKTPSEIDRRYTRKFKEIILNAPLIDTRLLYKSIDVTAEIDLSYSAVMASTFPFTVKIYAEPYLCYHIIPMQLLSWFRKSRSFGNTTQIFRLYFRAYLQNIYPSIDFTNIKLELVDIIIINQPEGGSAYDFFTDG